MKAGKSNEKSLDDLGLDINTRVDQFESQLCLEMKDMHSKFNDLSTDLRDFKSVVLNAL